MYYNRIDFLKFFNEEVFVAEQGQLIDYLLFTNDFTFSLYLVVYEDCAIISLTKYQGAHAIFNISLENISKIICNETSLFFYKGKESEIDLNRPDYTVVVKPKVSIDWELNGFYTI